jgi:Zn-dependent peptidase ImmA (M78 family)/transcriptional regulator with XRE-family HTH domain
MSIEALAENLKRLRNAKGLSQAAMADLIGLSRENYRRIETGSAEPRASTLLNIAEALSVTLNELLAPVRRLQAVRYRATKKHTGRENVLANVSRWLEDYNYLEGALDRKRSWQPPNLGGDLSIPEKARAVRAAMHVADEATIRDICGLLEHVGIKVCPMPVASEAFFGLSVGPRDGGPAIIVNTWDRIPVERWIFTAAHELGHLVLHLNSPNTYHIDTTDEDPGQETEANVFASHFLMPDWLFRKEWAEAAGLPFVDRVLKVKRIFKVSYKTVLYRVDEHMGKKGEVWWRFPKAYLQQYGRSLKKTDEPQPVGREAFAEIRPDDASSFAEPRGADEPDRLSRFDFYEDGLSRLVRDAVQGDLVTLARGAEILGIGVDEMQSRATNWDV